jgi:transcriptional regulator with XRE-family HTH domain
MKGDGVMDCIEFGCLIKTNRLKQNLTQKQLAEKVNVTDKAVSKWERGECFPDINLFKEISEVLDVPIEDLMQQGESKEEHNKRKQFNKKKRLFLIIWGLLGLIIMLVYTSLPVRLSYDVNVLIKRNARMVIVGIYILVFVCVALIGKREK